jgi:site-specific DNA recombinase
MRVAGCVFSALRSSMISTIRRAAIYTRVSTDKQNPLSPTDQQRKCREYAHTRGIVVLDAHVYCDEGLSGVGFDRPALQQMLTVALSAARPFEVILVDDTSRLSRTPEDSLGIYRRLKFAGLQLVAVSQNIDSLEEQAETLLTIHGLIDSTYVQELRKKTHRGCEGAVLRGLHVGGSCFGYRTVAVGELGSKRLVVKRDEAEIVTRIFEMSAAGHSLKGITKRLNDERVANRRDWCPSGIRSMLKRELYKGEVIWNKSRFEKLPGTNKRRAKPRPENEWIRIDRPELAIVSTDLWGRVQSRLDFYGKGPSEGRRRGLLSRAITSPYLFSGLLKCGFCGANLIIGTGGGTHVHPKYVCSNYFNRSTCDNDLYIRRDALEERLLARLQNELLKSEVLEYAFDEFGRQMRKSLSEMDRGLAGFRLRAEQLKTEIARLVDAIAQGGALDSLVSSVETRERELKALNNRLFSSGEVGLEERLNDARSFVEGRLRDLRGLLNQDPVLAKAELHSHIKEIRMIPRAGASDWHYEAVGSWDVLGSGPNAPVLALAHSDGCGGQI